LTRYIINFADYFKFDITCGRYSIAINPFLTQECRVPKGSDKGWVEKLYDKCKKWEHFSKPRLSQSAFIVRHFADMVEYESAGFLDKYRDTVLEEQLSILKASKSDLLSDLFMENGVLATANSAAGAKGKTAKGPPPAGKKQNKKTVSLSVYQQCIKKTIHYLKSFKVIILFLCFFRPIYVVSDYD